MRAFICILLVWCQIVIFVFSHNDGRDEICQQFSDLYMRQCSSRGPLTITGHPSKGSSGKRGPIGIKGPVGPIGAKGPPGIVDYDIVDRKIAAVEAELNDKIDRLLEENTQLKQQMNSTMRKIVKLGGRCDVLWNDKCFYAIQHNTQDVNKKEAEIMCSNSGWNLANIYSSEHYDLISDFLITKVEPAGYSTVWVGMKWNANTKTMFLLNGDRASYTIPWLSGYPSSSLTDISVYVDKYRDTGILNFPASSSRRGALCEL